MYKNPRPMNKEKTVILLEQTIPGEEVAAAFVSIEPGHELYEDTMSGKYGKVPEVDPEIIKADKEFESSKLKCYRMQFKAVLQKHEKLTAIEKWILTQNFEMKLLWKEATIFSRGSPGVKKIQKFAKITDKKFDEMFVEAKQINF